jgi:hypothetical protein
MTKEPQPYKNKGRCPKCNTKLRHEGQTGACPPSMHCYACGYRDWDHKGMDRPDFDLINSAGGRP